MIMNLSKKKNLLALLVSIAVFGAGCTTVVMEAGKKAWEDRSTEDQVKDTKIATGILDRLSEKDKGLLLDLNVDVWEQRVMLTGTLDNANSVKEVVSLAKSDERIKKLYNEIQVVSAEEKNKRREEAKKEEEKEGGAGQTVNDIWVNTKIKAQLLTGKNVTSVNYRWRSVLNNVYVIGRAKDQAEKDKVLQLIGWTKGVKSVKDFIEVK